MSLISTKLGPINSSCIKLVRSFISIRSITDSSTKKQVSNETQKKPASTQQEEIDWFSNKSTHSANKNGKLVFLFFLIKVNFNINFN